MSMLATFSLAALVSAAPATGQNTLPIDGVWVSEPSPDYVDSANLKITDRMIAFGPGSEKIASWHKQDDLIRITTSSEREFLFRAGSESRICLVLSVRPASGLGSRDQTPARCFVKKVDG